MGLEEGEEAVVVMVVCGAHGCCAVSFGDVRFGLVKVLEIVICKDDLESLVRNDILGCSD